MYNSNTKKRYSGGSGRQNNRRNSKPKAKGVSSLDPRMLIRSARPQEADEFKPACPFSQMDLQPALLRNLAQKGYKDPTAIQEASIAPLLAGRNLVGVANTGTGKTGAFLIPLIEQYLTGKEHFTSLVVVPTRELALQVEEEFKSLVQGMQLYSSCFIGGTSVGQDLAKLRRRNDLIVGTPGRLMDLSNRGALRLDKFSVLILDEFDRMLDMGFVHEIKRMVAMMRNRRQTMLFSATVDPGQKDLIRQMVDNPVEVKVSTGSTASDTIEQQVIHVGPNEDKFELLMNLISEPDFNKVLVFAETKRMVDKVSKKLSKSGVPTGLIHGNKSQNFRNRAITQFKKGSIRVLVATDVAARGIDIDDISHVINYQLPMTMDSYVHRIGRTGRAGKRGMAYTFVG